MGHTERLPVGLASINIVPVAQVLHPPLTDAPALVQPHGVPHPVAGIAEVANLFAA